MRLTKVYFIRFKWELFQFYYSIMIKVGISGCTVALRGNRPTGTHYRYEHLPLIVFKGKVVHRWFRYGTVCLKLLVLAFLHTCIYSI